MNRDWLHIPFEEKEQTQGERRWVRSFYHQAHVRVLVLCNHQENVYFLQISNSLLLNSIESQCSATDVYSMPLLIICFLLALIFIQCSETTLPNIKGEFEL